ELSSTCVSVLSSPTYSENRDRYLTCAQVLTWANAIYKRIAAGTIVHAISTLCCVSISPATGLRNLGNSVFVVDFSPLPYFHRKTIKIASVRKKKKAVIARITLNRKSTLSAWVETPSGIHQPRAGAAKHSAAIAIMLTAKNTAHGFPTGEYSCNRT